MQEFKIKLNPTAEWLADTANADKVIDYTGYYLIATFNQRVFANVVFARAKADFDENGIGYLSLPPKSEIVNEEINFEIFSSFGNNVRQKFYRMATSFYGDKDGVIEMSVTPDETNTLKTNTYEVNGKLLDLENKFELSNLQIVLFSSESDEPTLLNSKIVANSKTFKDGYFKFIIPIPDKLYKYFLVVENSASEFYTLEIDEALTNKPIKNKQIIAVELFSNDDEIESKDDCGCHKKKELPNELEFANANSNYSEDIGGNCVNFTAPNRTIDEFSFYHVVRTTEPEIKSVAITNNDLYKLYADINNAIKPITTSFIGVKLQNTIQLASLDAVRSSIQAIPVKKIEVKRTQSAKLKTVALATSPNFTLIDFSTALVDTTRFTQLYISVQTNIQSQYNSLKSNIEKEETNINNLLADFSYQLNSIKTDTNNLNKLGDLNALKYKLQEIEIAISNYIKHCEELIQFYENDVNEKFLSKDVPFINEIKLSKSKFQNTQNSLTASINNIIQTYIINHPGRRNVNVENEIDWDNNPTVYHNTTIAHGHVLHLKQIWKNAGYSLGKILNSIALLPGQQKNIAVMEWNRTNISARTEDQTNIEELSANLSRDRDVSEVMNSAFSENIRASSQVQSKTSGWSVGASVGFPVGPVMVGVSGGYSSSKSSANSSASQDANRNLSANSLNKLRDSINQSATSLRSQRSTVVQTVSQNESFAVTTEVIANYNHCHALTMQYFEILRHIVIEQKLVDVQECLFVPLPMDKFDDEKVLRWKNTLSGILIDRSLYEGLNAVSRIKTNYQDIDYPDGRFCDDLIDYLDGEMTISFEIARPADEVKNENDQITDDIEKLKNHWNNNPILRHFPSLQAQVINNYKEVKINEQKQRDAIFENEIVPKIVEHLIDKLTIRVNNTTDLTGIDFTLIDVYENRRVRGWAELRRYAQEGRLSELSAKGRPLRIKFHTTSPINIKRSAINSLQIYFDLSETTDNSYPHRILLHSFKSNYSTLHYKGNLATSYNIKDDIKLNANDNAWVQAPLNFDEKRNPKKEDKAIAKRLLNHLEEYREFYHKQIWLSMDPNRLFGLIDGFIAPHSGGRSIASVCENRIIGVVGNNLILPVVPGVKLDPTYHLAEGATLLEHYQPTTPPDPFRICIPTNGVYGEAVMGACNSCEKIDDTRYWKWEEHPIPNKPTEINPINTDTRYVDPGNLQTKEMATPMVNIQNAPEAPAPTGLSSVFEIMGKNGIFGDMTGLQGSQEIVKHALTENAKQLANTQANAVEGMKLAKQIYDSQQANKDVQRKVQEIDKAFPTNGTEEQKAKNAELKEGLIKKGLGLDTGKTSGNFDDKLNKIKEIYKDKPEKAEQFIDALLKKEFGLIDNPVEDVQTENEGIDDANELGFNYIFNQPELNTENNG